jgi:hypothetical protein
MSRLFDQNREQLTNLIYSLNEFTEDGLVERFKKESNGSTLIDGIQTISSYLKELTQIGVISYQNGRYITSDESNFQ